MERKDAMRDALGEVVCLHDLRHAFATLAMANYVDVMTVAGPMGHRDAGTTLDVCAIAPEESKGAAMDEMDSVLS